MILELVLIYLLAVSQSNQDFDIKKKLLAAWEQQGDSDDPGEIVYDFFQSDHSKDQADRKKSDSSEDDIIIMPFFSDEVFTLSDLPEEKNWNFVEIDSSKDLVAMENPKQRKYKTQRFKMKPKPSKKFRNNWNLFKDKFPSFNSKIISNTKKEKRQVSAASQKTSETVMSDPWARVDIKTENNPVINFGSYDEFGRKIQHLSPLEDRLMTDVVEDLHNPREQGKQDDMVWNITINLDQTDSPSRRTKNTEKIQPDSTSTAGKNDRMSEFSEKLEILYEKLEALQSIKAARARLSPRPPVGKVPLLDRPIAVIVRPDSHPHSRPALLQTSFNIKTKAGQSFKPAKSRNSMLSTLKDKLGFLIPPKIKQMLQKKSYTDRKVGPPQPPQPKQPQQPQPPQQQLQTAKQPVGRRAVNPPWHHNGIPPEIQARINSKIQQSSTSAIPSQTAPRKQNRTFFDILLPKLGF